MKGIRYILSLLVLIVTTISCERDDDHRYPMQGAGRPIQFSVKSEWPVITKSAIGSLNDLKNDGFVVWANWTKDPNDKLNYAGDNEKVVFGINGTKVNAYDDGDNTFQPNQDTDDKWICEEEQEWNRGYYNFTAALPTSAFGEKAQINSGILTSSFKQTKDEDKSASTEYSSLITLELNENGFDLSRSQIDLMYAFHNEDNSAEASSAVNLNFEHAFSLINIQLSYSNLIPYVDKVTLYGIHNKIYGDLKYRRDVSIDGDEVKTVNTNNIYELLAYGDISTSQIPYAVYTYTGSDFTYTVPGTINIVENLLVFPETLSQQCAMRIEIDCHVAGRARTIYTEISSGSWKSGESYTYQIDATGIRP